MSDYTATKTDVFTAVLFDVGDIPDEDDLHAPLLPTSSVNNDYDGNPMSQTSNTIMPSALFQLLTGSIVGIAAAVMGLYWLDQKRWTVVVDDGP